MSAILNWYPLGSRELSVRNNGIKLDRGTVTVSGSIWSVALTRHEYKIMTALLINMNRRWTSMDDLAEYVYGNPDLEPEMLHRTMRVHFSHMRTKKLHHIGLDIRSKAGFGAELIKVKANG